MFCTLYPGVYSAPCILGYIPHPVSWGLISFFTHSAAETKSNQIIINFHIYIMTGAGTWSSVRKAHVREAFLTYDPVRHQTHTLGGGLHVPPPPPPEFWYLGFGDKWYDFWRPNEKFS